MVMFAGLAFFCTACGKKGPLIYPDMLIPAQPTAVIARQSGAAVKLQFTLPDKDRAGRPLKGVTGVKISKRTNVANQKDVCSSCTIDYQLFRTLYVDLLPTDTQRFGSRLILLDSDVSAGNNYSYSIVPFTAEGVDGAVSAAADVRMTVPLPAPVVKIESFPTEVKLHLSSRPIISGQLLGYNLYRSSARSPRFFQPLNKEPLKVNEYVDSTLERGVKYRYTARTLILRAPGDIGESTESDEVVGVLKDDE
jgi:predicted small lipoprotein YifL